MEKSFLCGCQPFACYAECFPEKSHFGNFRCLRVRELPMRSELRELNKVGEFLFKDFRNVGFCRIRTDRYSHGDSAATQGTGRYADVSTAPLAVGHFARIVDGNSRRMQRDFEMEDLAILCDAMVHVVDAFNGVSEDRGPLRNVAGLRQNVVKLARF
jgi:hypothetical protein